MGDHEHQRHVGDLPVVAQQGVDPKRRGHHLEARDQRELQRQDREPDESQGDRELDQKRPPGGIRLPDREAERREAEYEVEGHPTEAGNRMLHVGNIGDSSLGGGERSRVVRFCRATCVRRIALLGVRFGLHPSDNDRAFFSPPFEEPRCPLCVCLRYPPTCCNDCACQFWCW